MLNKKDNKSMKNRIYSSFLRSRASIVGATLLFQLVLLGASTTVVQGSALPGISMSATGGTTGFITYVLCNIIAFWMFSALMALTVVFVLVAAYKYLTSGGEPAKVSEATKVITFAAVSVVVALFARAFPFFISGLFDLTNGGTIVAC
jgi:hypothetical protein